MSLPNSVAFQFQVHLRFENVMATQLDNTGAFTETLINVHCSKNEMK